MKKCKSCGMDHQDVATVCSVCGGALGAATPAQTYQQPPQPVQPSQPQQAGQYQGYQNANPYGGQPQQPVQNQGYQNVNPYGGQPQQPVQNQSYPYANPYNQQVGQNQGDQNVNQKFKSLGGWLMAFVIVSILDVFFTIVQSFQDNGLFSLIESRSYFVDIPSLKMAVDVLIITDAILLVAVVLEVIYIIFIFTRNSNFLKCLQIFRIVVLVAGLLTVVATFMMSSYTTEAIPTAVGTLIGAFLSLFLVTMYFCKSERVNTYMGSDEYKKKALFRIGV